MTPLKIITELSAANSGNLLKIITTTHNGIVGRYADTRLGTMPICLAGLLKGKS